MRFLTTFFLFFLVATTLFAQWQPFDGPYGTTARSLAKCGNALLADTNGGLYYSLDEGENWSLALRGAVSRGFVSDLKSDGNNAIVRINNTETGEYEHFISTDGAESWGRLNLPDSFNGYRGMAFNGEVILYRTIIAGYVSYDNGESWDFMGFGIGIPSEVFTIDGLLYIRNTIGELYRTTDSSATEWVQVNAPVRSSFRIEVLIKGDTMIAGYANDSIFYSHNGGQDWDVASGVDDFDSGDNSLASLGDTFYALNNNRLYSSTDGGASWAMVSNSRIFSGILPLEEHLLLIASGEIVSSSDEGTTVSPQMEGINGAFITEWAVQNDGITYMKGRDQLFHASVSNLDITIDSSLTFQETNIDEMISVPGNYVFYGASSFSSSQTQKIYRISPEGEQQLVTQEGNQPWLASDHLEYQDGKLFYYTNGPDRFSEDLGETWQSITELAPFSFSDFVRYEGSVFAMNGGKVQRKRDGETVWVEVSNGLQLDEFPVGTRGNECRLISTEGALFALISRSSNTGYDIYVTHDEGDNWQLTAEELEPITYPTLNAPPGVKGLISIGGYHIMAARDNGMVISGDQGRNWTLFNEGLPTDRIEEMHLINGKIVVSTDDNGFWQLDTDGIQLKKTVGTVYYDANDNDVFDGDEGGVPMVKMLLENGEDLAFTNADGVYTMFFRNDGSFGPEVDSPYFVANPSSRQTDAGDTLDFGLQLTQNVNDLRVNLETDNVHRPGFSNRYYLHYENRAAPTEGVSLEIVLDPQFTFDGANQDPDQQVGNTLTYELGDLAPLQSGMIVLYLTVDRTAMLGGAISSIATISSAMAAEETPTDNVVTLTDNLVGSYDPNDIAVDLSIVTPMQLADGQLLNYRIRFQNTGTYPAETVVVRNEIDPGLQLGSIKSVEASHDFEIVVEDDRLLAFVFENIQLADSTRDEAASHGYITYTIAVSEELMNGDSIVNQAAIYFDFNEPIITNEAVTVVERPAAVRPLADQLSGKVYPNPVTSGDRVAFELDSPAGTLTVFDPLGRPVSQQKAFHPATDQLNTAGLQPGVYWIGFTGPKGSSSFKLLVR